MFYFAYNLKSDYICYFFSLTQFFIHTLVPETKTFGFVSAIRRVKVKVTTCVFTKRLRPCLANYFSSLNFHHSIFITHHSIFHTRLASSPNFHHSIFFTLFVGPYLSAGVGFFFFFSPLSLVSLGTKEKKIE